MKDIFLADAHLVSPEDANYRKLLAFLEEQRGSVRTLYLLGDIFEFWVGYRHVVFSTYIPLLEALRRLRESGTQIVYVEGNHDFHLGPYLEETLGCRVLPDGGTVEIDGRPVAIAHGDLLNPDDRGYRLLRRVLRSRPLRWLIALLPPDFTWSVARWAGRKSRRHTGASDDSWTPEELIAAHARSCFNQGCAAVVTGHFHFPQLRQTEQGTIIALGDWIAHFSYAVYEDGTFSLQTA